METLRGEFHTNEQLAQNQKQLEVEAAALQEEEELLTRLRNLPQASRRRTMETLRGEFHTNFPRDLFQEKPVFTMESALKAGEDRRSTLYVPGGERGYQPDMQTAMGESHKPNIYVDTQVKKIKSFSGKKKPCNGELDYRHWRRSAVRVRDDTEMPESRKKKVIFDSLQGKADDIIDFHRDQTLSEIFSILDASFKYMVDGDDLLADYYQMIQEEKNPSSEFLSDLYIELVEVVKEEGATIGQMPRLLLKQFIRGCRDEDLIAKLRLENKISDPPAFPVLMADIRREEARRTERKLRLKRGMTLRTQAVTVSDAEVDPELEALQKKVNKLESLCSNITANANCANSPANCTPAQETVSQDSEVAQIQHRLAKVEERLTKVRHQSLFCYRCGIDAHIATDCKHPPNKALVQLKMEQRKEMFKSPSQGNSSEN